MNDACRLRPTVTKAECETGLVVSRGDCRSFAIVVQCMSGDQLGHFPDGSCKVRTVQPESDTTMEYLPAVSLDQPDSGSRAHGQKTLLACRQFDCTCGIVAPSVDVTAAGCGESCRRSESDRLMAPDFLWNRFRTRLRRAPLVPI